MQHVLAPSFFGLFMRELLRRYGHHLLNGLEERHGSRHSRRRKKTLFLLLNDQTGDTAFLIADKRHVRILSGVHAAQLVSHSLLGTRLVYYLEVVCRQCQTPTNQTRVTFTDRNGKEPPQSMMIRVNPEERMIQIGPADLDSPGNG
jgi:hypothetical protein